MLFSSVDILRQRTHDIEVKKYCISLLEKLGSFQYTRKVLEALDVEARAEVGLKSKSLSLAILLKCGGFFFGVRWLVWEEIPIWIDFSISSCPGKIVTVTALRNPIKSITTMSHAAPTRTRSTVINSRRGRRGSNCELQTAVPRPEPEPPPLLLLIWKHRNNSNSHNVRHRSNNDTQPAWVRLYCVSYRNLRSSKDLLYSCFTLPPKAATKQTNSTIFHFHRSSTSTREMIVNQHSSSLTKMFKPKVNW